VAAVKRLCENTLPELLTLPCSSRRRKVAAIELFVLLAQFTNDDELVSDGMGCIRKSVCHNFSEKPTATVGLAGGGAHGG